MGRATCILTLVGGLMNAGCAPKPPRLAVLIVVDSFGTEYLTRGAPYFGEDGFNRLTRDGAVFPNARFGYANTVTGPGHATIVTGANPAVHGIPDNQWYRPGSDEPVTCVDDIKQSTIGMLTTYDSFGCSPRSLLVPTVGDSLKERYGAAAKVWSMSLKARAAILTGGQHADGAIWFLPKTGDYVTSDFYGGVAPAWCKELNRDRYADRFLHTKWDRVLPDAAYETCAEDNAAFEQGHLVLFINTLPKELGERMDIANRIYYEQVQCSPWGNELVLEAARRAVVQEHLGQDETPDLLIVALSSPDIVGHTFGPESHEMLDTLVRTDRQIGEWLAFLDQNVGRENYNVVLTADHGMGPTPERAIEAGEGGGRIDQAELLLELHRGLEERFEPAGEGFYYLTAVDMPWVFLNETVLGFHKIDINEAADAVAATLRLKSGFSTVAAAHALLDRPESELSSVERLMRESIRPGRCGHVYAHLDRNWGVVGSCAGHGTSHDYDAVVPVILTGPAFRAARFDDSIEMNDVAPTLSRLLGVQPPLASRGRVLGEAFAK